MGAFIIFKYMKQNNAAYLWQSHILGLMPCPYRMNVQYVTWKVGNVCATSAAALLQLVRHVLMQSLLLMMMITLFGGTEEKGGAD